MGVCKENKDIIKCFKQLSKDIQGLKDELEIANYLKIVEVYNTMWNALRQESDHPIFKLYDRYSRKIKKFID